MLPLETLTRCAGQKRILTPELIREWDNLNIHSPDMDQEFWVDLGRNFWSPGITIFRKLDGAKSDVSVSIFNILGALGGWDSGTWRIPLGKKIPHCECTGYSRLKHELKSLRSFQAGIPRRKVSYPVVATTFSLNP